MSEANQLFITSKKKSPEEYGAGKWGYFNFDGTFTAWKNLKPASFALYLFLLRDQPGFNRTLYKVEFENSYYTLRNCLFNINSIDDKYNFIFQKLIFILII